VWSARADDSDHTIVTSDSLGSVTFWDGASMAQKQHFQAHKADGMCLLIGPVSPLLFLSAPPPSSENGRRDDTEKEHEEKRIKLNCRTERQSSLPDQTNESVNSPTSPHHPISP
jgi:hypothetical protein